NPITASSEIVFYDGVGVATGLQNQVNKTITAITFNPAGSQIVYQYDPMFGYLNIGTAPLTNPTQNVYFYTSTSFVRLTIPGHGFNDGDKIFTGSLSYIFPSLGAREYTVQDVQDANNIIINLGEIYT